MTAVSVAGYRVRGNDGRADDAGMETPAIFIFVACVSHDQFVVRLNFRHCADSSALLELPIAFL